MTTTPITSYEEAVANHEWHVPERYNIAQDVCDKHPADKLAMIHEHFDGTVREVFWGELQALSNQFANVLRARGVEKGDRVAMLLPPTPETAAAFFGTWKCGAILLSMSVLYGDDGIRHRVSDSQAKILVTNAANQDRVDPSLVQDVLLLDDELLASGEAEFTPEDTLAEDPAQLYYTSGTTGLAKGIVHAHRYLLAHEEFIYCHDVRDGERFHGMGEWAWAAGIAPLLGPWRFGAVQLVYQREGGFDPHKQLDFLSRHEASNVFTTPTAMRSMMGISDAGTRYPQKFRIVCSRRRAAEPGGDPLVPRPVRADRARLLRAHRVISPMRELSVHGGPRGVDGAPDARLGHPDPRPGREPGAAGRARRDLPARPLEPALSARLLAQRGGGARDLRRRLVPHQGRGEVRRGRLRLVRGAGRRRDHRRGLPDRAVRGRVGVPRARGGQGGGGGRLAGRAPRVGGEGVHRARRGGFGLGRARREIQDHVRSRLSAYAYPRKIEFVEDLPKTLTGKIRRIELRQRELEGKS